MANLGFLRVKSSIYKIFSPRALINNLTRLWVYYAMIANAILIGIADVITCDAALVCIITWCDVKQ
eukprot:4787759-Ditylum_brightwellii.AAC.1